MASGHKSLGKDAVTLGCSSQALALGAELYVVGATPRGPGQRDTVLKDWHPQWLPFPVWYPLTKPLQGHGSFLRRLSPGI